jgi:hypothetical protein
MTEFKIPRPGVPPIYRDAGTSDLGLNRGRNASDEFWPPKVVWASEQGWLNVRDPWGQWHSIRAKDAPSGWARLASREKGR